MIHSKLCKYRALLVLAAISLAGCDAFSSEPTYGGLSVEGFNYTPYNLTEFTIRDKSEIVRAVEVIFRPARVKAD